MSYLTRFSVGALILGVSLSVSVPAQASAAHEQAKQILAQANADLTAAQDRADTAQQLSDAAKARATEIATRIENERNDVKAMRDRLMHAEAAVPEIQAKMDSAAARQSARQKEMVVADLKYGPLKYHDEEVRLNAVHDFESSADYRSALKSVEDQAAATRAVETKSIENLSSTPEYKQAVIESPAAVDALREKRLAVDPNVAIARNKLAEAKKGVDESRRHFMMEQLPEIPKVKLADAALREEQANYDKIAAASKAAEADGAAAAQLMERQKAGLAQDHATLDRMNSEIAQLQLQADKAQADVDRADKGLQVAVAYLNSSEQSRSNAQATLDALEAPPSGPVLPYYGGGAAAPSYIFVQSAPSNVYFRGAYSGGNYFVPAGVQMYGYYPGFVGYAGRPVYFGVHFHGNQGGHRR